MRRPDRRRNGGADRGFRRLPHHLRHGQGDRPGDEHRGRASPRETRRQIGRVARAGRQGQARMSPMITVDEALKRVLASAEMPLEEETVALSCGYGRVLEHDLKALRTQPPFANSAMDGYALRAADTASPPATLTVIGESAAGRAFAGVVGAGQAVRIFTGAPIPAGAEAVVIQEDVRREDGLIR